MKHLLPKTKYSPQGFTLIELMVVISIIAILSVIGLTVFTGVQKNARDAKRRADVNAISSAMEKNYVSGSITPYSAAAATDFADGKVPLDPKNSDPYLYVVTGTLPGASYVICATLENTTAGNSTSGTTMTSGAGTYFCQQNQQ